METGKLLPPAGGIAGGGLAISSYGWRSERPLDSICVTLAGALIGADAGRVVEMWTTGASVGEKALETGAMALSVGAGIAVGYNWAKQGGHTDAGGVGIGVLTAIGVRIGLSLLGVGQDFLQ